MLIRRSLAAIPILLIVSALLFGVLRLLPVDPAAMSLPPNATHDEIEAKRREMGLDQPLPASTRSGSARAAWRFRPLDPFPPRRRATDRRDPARDHRACALAMLFAGLLGFAGGLLLFHVRGRATEPVGRHSARPCCCRCRNSSGGCCSSCCSACCCRLLPFTGRLPGCHAPIVTGFLLLDTLLVGRPDCSWTRWQHLMLPAAALGIAFSPAIMRVLRSSLIDVYQEDYIHQARLRGLSRSAASCRATR